MQIGFITSMKAGLTQFVFRDIDALVQKGHRVTLFALHHNKGLYNPLPEWDVVPAARWRSIRAQLWFAARNPILYVALLWTALRTKSFVDLTVAIQFAAAMPQIDVIYSYFGDHKLFTGYYCKRITGIPLVVTIRAYELYCNPNPEMFRMALPYCDRVVTITEHNRKLLSERFGVPPDSVDIVRQIVDLHAFKDSVKITVLIVGFFAEKKGHEVLFRALRMLDREDVELWVVGDRNRSILGVDCHRLAKEMGIESKVAFFGAQKNTALRALYRECDIFCLPSRPDRHGNHEGFPNVIAEAMAFGKPVVSTRHAGIPEAIDSILVDENDAEQLAAALTEACDSAELRRQLGRRNRAAAEMLFSLANNDRLEEILLRHSRKGGTGCPAELGQNAFDRAEHGVKI